MRSEKVRLLSFKARRQLASEPILDPMLKLTLSFFMSETFCLGGKEPRLRRTLLATLPEASLVACACDIVGRC